MCYNLHAERVAIAYYCSYVIDGFLCCLNIFVTLTIMYSLSYDLRCSYFVAAMIAVLNPRTGNAPAMELFNLH